MPHQLRLLVTSTHPKPAALRRASHWRMKLGTTEDKDNIDAIGEVLLRYGERYHGWRPVDVAREWDRYDFTAVGVELWCEAGVWKPDLAAEFAAAEMAPDDVQAAADRLVKLNGADRYTDGCPIYACCNGDLDPAAIIAAHCYG